MQFKNAEEINRLKIKELLDIDFEEIKQLKTKTSQFIDACSILLQDKLEKLKDDEIMDENILENEVMCF